MSLAARCVLVRSLAFILWVRTNFDTIIVSAAAQNCCVPAPNPAGVKQIKRVFPTKAHKEQSARGAEQWKRASKRGRWKWVDDDDSGRVIIIIIICIGMRASEEGRAPHWFGRFAPAVATPAVKRATKSEMRDSKVSPSALKERRAALWWEYKNNAASPQRALNQPRKSCAA